MATGDYHHTAISVAQGVGMLAPHSQVIIIQTEKETMPSNLPHAASLQASNPLQKAEDSNAQQIVSQLSGQGMPAVRQSALWTTASLPSSLGSRPL